MEPKKRGRPRKNPLPEKQYFKETTDFNQVALFNQLFANIFDRNRDKSIGEVLDYIVSNGGYALSNRELMEFTNKIGIRMEMRTPGPNENKTPDV